MHERLLEKHHRGSGAALAAMVPNVCLRSWNHAHAGSPARASAVLKSFAYHR